MKGQLVYVRQVLQTGAASRTLASLAATAWAADHTNDLAALK